ncbi:MAG: C4-dicarboxylate transporter DcuC [Atopobiaceae bacterium]|jgi:DcuC family C4-dicarboxylate transporter
MSPVVMVLSALLAVAVIVYMLIKKLDIKIALFLMGILLMFVAMATGGGIAIKDFESSGVPLLDPLLAIISIFKSTLTGAGFIILVLGGYTSYMSAIGANDVTVSVLTKPIKHIKSAYVLVPIVFLLGNLLSLVVPSASNLAIILLATLYPVLRKAGMSPLTAGAVIATSATVMPTPLGSDNVAIANELAKYPEFAGLTVSHYVFAYHALVSIPTLIFMAVVHYFWQKAQDKRGVEAGEDQAEIQDIKVIEGSGLYKFVYALLPVLPILLLIIVYILQLAGVTSMSLSVEIATLFSFVVAIICDLIKRRNAHDALQETEKFFKGMGGAMPIVALLVAASVFVLGLRSIGLISLLQGAMTGMNGSGMGWVLPLILIGLTALIVLLSGSGTALFFAMVPLIPALAAAAGISAIAVAVPMGLAGNLLRAVSPVSAVVIIVAGSLKVNPLQIVKRTSVPMIAGCVFMFILSMVLFL